MSILKLRKSLGRLTFFCGKCNKDIQPKLDSLSLKSYRRKELDLSEALRRLKIAHERHVHTEYDSLREKIEQELTLTGRPKASAKFLAKVEAKRCINNKAIIT